MAPSIIADDSLWPLLISRFEGPVSDEIYREYLRQGTRYLQRGEPYVCVFDTLQMILPTASQRQILIQWMRQNERLMRENVHGCAFIITSPVIRMMLSAIFHVVPLPVPYVAVQDLTQAVTWAMSRMKEAGHSEAAARILQRFHAPE
jgi:hypothetical protein